MEGVRGQRKEDRMRDKIIEVKYRWERGNKDGRTKLPRKKE